MTKDVLLTMSNQQHPDKHDWNCKKGNSVYLSYTIHKIRGLITEAKDL